MKGRSSNWRKKVPSSRTRFIEALRANEPLFNIDLHAETRFRLADYYEAVIEHNDLLHLVAPCTAETFASRHVLESLTLLSHLPEGAQMVDVGAGAGLPSLPCLLARGDLGAVLVESKLKKASFLTYTVEKLGLAGRAAVIARQFEEADSPPEARFVTSRALDRFEKKLPKLVKWAKNRELLLFGGPGLADHLSQRGLTFSEELMPLSDQRFLYTVPAPPRAGV
jgi:16S rRNA (guanine(527)-N(7))-methyltransferase RsmG